MDIWHTLEKENVFVIKSLVLSCVDFRCTYIHQPFQKKLMAVACARSY
jgi:hypothetical protein